MLAFEEQREEAQEAGVHDYWNRERARQCQELPKANGERNTGCSQK